MRALWTGVEPASTFRAMRRIRTGLAALGTAVLVSTLCEATGQDGRGVFGYRNSVGPAQNLSTLRGTFSGAPTDTDLRGTFVWLRRDGRWRLVTNQLTAVGP